MALASSRRAAADAACRRLQSGADGAWGARLHSGNAALCGVSGVGGLSGPAEGPTADDSVLDRGTGKSGGVRSWRRGLSWQTSPPRAETAARALGRDVGVAARAPRKRRTARTGRLPPVARLNRYSSGTR